MRFNALMPKFTLLIAVGLAAIATTAAAQADKTSRGRLLVQRYCASCHAIDRSGRSPNHAAPPFRDLSARYKIDDLAEALAEGILTGHPAMPEMKFPPEDVKAILAYIRSIQAHQQAITYPPPVS
jgi:mono/diheme cytochrome c family protein